MASAESAVLVVMAVITVVSGAFVVTTGPGGQLIGPGGEAVGPGAEPVAQQQQGPRGPRPNRCLREGTTQLAKFEAFEEDLFPEGTGDDPDDDPEGGTANGVTVSNVSTDDDNEPVSFNWSSNQQIAYVQVFGGNMFQNYSSGTSGFVDFGVTNRPAISNVIFCVPTETPPTPTETPPTPTETPPTPTETPPTPTETPPTPTETPPTPTETPPTPTETPTETPPTPTETPPTPTETPTETPTDTPTATPTDTPTATPESDVLYWQVDFGAGESPPEPPYYENMDLVAALGNSANGVTENPSYSQQRRQGQLQNVTIVGGAFTFDDANSPTSVTVQFRLAEGAEPRTLHLATFVLPGPFTYGEIDQQRLFDSASVRIQPGETASLTVDIPQPSDRTNSVSPWLVGFQLIGVGLGSVVLLVRRRDD